MKNQFKNLTFKSSTELKESVINELVTNTGVYAITLTNDDYDYETGGYRPYQIIVERYDDGTFTLIRILECVKDKRNEFIASNLFDFESNAHFFEHVGRLTQDEMGDEELSEVYDMFTNNIAAYYKSGCYSSVDVDKLN